MTKPDLTEQRQHAEAVAYGKLLALREVLDALHEDRPSTLARRYDPSWRSDYVRGDDRAVRTVKAMRLGVEK